MKYKYIPVNNDLDKAVAFANSLDSNFVVNRQKIKQSPTFINPLDVVRILQKDGWELKGVDEARNKRRQITSHYLNLQHPDMKLSDTQGKGDSISSLYISNNCDGNTPMKIELGVYRMVCSNGLMSRKIAFNSKIKHVEMDYTTLLNQLSGIKDASLQVMDSFKHLQKFNLTNRQIDEYTDKVMNIPFNKRLTKPLTQSQLLATHRSEDEGDNLFSVFNRVQENLTADIKNKKLDQQINTLLFDMASQYAVSA